MTLRENPRLGLWLASVPFKGTAVLRLGRDGKAVPDGAEAFHSCTVPMHGENVIAIGSTREIAERRALKKLGAAG
jgi:hypothetical protein